MKVDSWHNNAAPDSACLRKMKKTDCIDEYIVIISVLAACCHSASDKKPLVEVSDYCLHIAQLRLDSADFEP
jgi:hypothetical protein